jgi:mRNA-decapping enzyme subunit 2
MPYTNTTLVDCLDDLCVRFIVNLPNEELQSVERICFQIEEAQWFYEDFIRPQDPNNLPSMHLRKFSQLMFQHCPLFSAYSEELHQQAYEQFLAYKTRVPVRGAIMLNEEMTHAVLVKGWKKGAKWSFPRGKINKEETNLDCAVREVWEETGYDLRKADLVEPDEDMKKITVTMREQSMMLYVFRGVPMDTYFEPQTRKEISKIDWYRLTDLPTLRRKNQVQQQQGAGQDLIKENSFYMVAPFLGPLKQWIKQQHKLGRQRARTAHLAPPVAGTDDEDIQPELYETTAEETVPVANAQPTDGFAEMVARLGRGQPTGDWPELSEQPQQIPDPAEALKRLLSVGMSMQSPPVEAPSHPTSSQPPPQANPLLALFHQGTIQSGGPRTPFEQMMPPPMQPSSPHGQHHPRPPQMGNMGPPPPFFPPHQNLPFRAPSGHFNGMPPPQMPPQFMQQSLQQRPMFPPQPPPNMQQAFDQCNIRPPFQEMGDSQFSGGNGRPVVPPASKLPTPNLNAHALGLLNSFRTNNLQSTGLQSPQTTVATPLRQSVQTTPKIQHPLPQHRPHGLVSPQAQFMPSPPQFQSPPISSTFVPEQPKPRNTHQDSLLSLFRPTPPLASPDPPPAELSALPTTPAYPSTQPVADPSRAPNQHLLGVFGAAKTNMTSATVSGPVNAPDFATMKKNTQSGGSSRGPSPATQRPFMPQQILKRGQPSPAPQVVAKVSGPTQTVITSHRGQPRPAVAAKVSNPAFKPQILKRPQQQDQQAQRLSPVPKPTAHAQGLLDMFKGPSPQPAPAQPVPITRSPAPPISGIDRRESVPSDQKNVLLSLFGNKPSPSPTPKTTMSGLISPVSPLPANGSMAASPEGMANRSRISSMGDGVPGIVIPPPTSQPSEGGVGLGNTNEGKSPVDKNFLLGFLADVAARGR